MAEGFPTFIAPIGFFLGVNPLVFYEEGALAEGSATLITLIGLLPSMDPLVFGQG